MPATKRQDNVQFVKGMMEFSDFGALAQFFILDAITKHANRVADAPIEDLRKAFAGNEFISPEAWQGVAKEIQTKMKERK